MALAQPVSLSLPSCRTPRVKTGDPISRSKSLRGTHKTVIKAPGGTTTTSRRKHSSAPALTRERSFARAATLGDELLVAMVTMPEIVKRFKGAGRSETNRHAMRESLFAAMGEGARAHFNIVVKDLTLSDDGTCTLHGRDGEELGSFDLTVDSSGVSSPLRKFRVAEAGTAHHYNGLTMVNGIVGDPERMLDPALVSMLGQGTLEVVGDRPDGNGGFLMLLQRYGNSASDHRAKLQTMFMRERRGQLAAELELGKIPYSHISKAEHPEAFSRVTQLLKDHMGDKWSSMYHELVDELVDCPLTTWLGWNSRCCYLFLPSSPLTSS